MDYDIVIRNGTVVDGLAAPRLQADVAIRRDRIVEVGSVSGAARRCIDATGRVVSPGFVDVHAHDDFALLDRPQCDFKVMQGVTSEIVGNCGFGAAPAGDAYREFLRDFGAVLFGPLGDFSWETTADFHRRLAAKRPAVNVASLVPHAAVRYDAMGGEARAPTRAELQRMQALVRAGMEAGAVGMSTGLFYAPGKYADTEEVIALARIVGEYGGVYATHMRDEADHLLDSVAETLRVGDEAKVAVQISHHKAMGNKNWGAVRESLALVDQAGARGVDVTSDVYPYTAGSTALSALVQGGALEIVEPSDVLIASTPRRRDYEGKTLADLSRQKAKSVDATVQEILAEEGNGVVAVIFGMDEADVRRVLSHPRSMIGSDGVPSVDGKPHPRLYGTFARVLGTYVRETNLLGLEDAVHRMTGLPCRKFGLRDRGVIGEGAYADLVLFDPTVIADVATYQAPRAYPAGIEFVIVNGQLAAAHGRLSAARNGRVLRFGK